MDPAGAILLDGSQGEGGGQILRTALALSAVTGRPFRLTRVRHARLKPGLRPQHREAVRAAARLCEAAVEGDEVGSPEVWFAPRLPVRPCDLALDIGTAGSAPLLFQTVCWPLALAGGVSRLTVRGGTHLAHSPTFHYLALVFAPAAARLGFRFDLELSAAGFYPEGGGELGAVIHPAHPMPPLDLRHRGTLREVEVLAMAPGLGPGAADALLASARRRLRDLGVAADGVRAPVPAPRSAGSHILVTAAFDRARTGHGEVGDRGAPPERVADAAVRDFAGLLRGGGAVDAHLADQLLVPAALLAAGLVPAPAGLVPETRYTVAAVTRHLTTNAAVVGRFLDVALSVSGAEGDEGEVRVAPAGGAP